MPKLVNHEERKSLIADAVFKLVQEIGFEKLTIRKIAQESELTLGGVQYYFSNQQQLYIYAMETLLNRTEERIYDSVKKGDDPLDGVTQMLKQLIPSGPDDQKMEIEAWLQFAIMARKDRKLNDFNKKIRNSTEQLMHHIISILTENALFRDDLDTNEEAKNLYVFIDGVTIQSILYPYLFGEEEIDAHIKNYLRKITIE
ncbi:TetR/AcrR family transcriptional regulator [Salinicoccus sp. Marseille-QA3877]